MLQSPLHHQRPYPHFQIDSSTPHYPRNLKFRSNFSNTAPDRISPHYAVGGHIPGAINVPAVMETENGQCKRWQTPTTKPCRTFKPANELHALFNGKGITSDKEVITYCVRGRLSTHMWFVPKYLLGYPQVREYDGSWAEWGNLIGVPVE